MYVKVEFYWGNGCDQRIRDILEKHSRNKLRWKASDGPPFNLEYNSHPLIDIKLARVICKHVEVSYFLVYDIMDNTLEDFEDKVTAIQVAAAPSQPALNKQVNVAIPGNALMAVEEVVVREDYCTDALQEDLDAGWCILAVCPQPKRRPDYVLGRLPRVVEDAETRLHQQTTAEYTKAATLNSFQPIPIAPVNVKKLPGNKLSPPEEISQAAIDTAAYEFVNGQAPFVIDPALTKEEREWEEIPF